MLKEICRNIRINVKFKTFVLHIRECWLTFNLFLLIYKNVNPLNTAAFKIQILTKSQIVEGVYVPNIKV